MLSPMLADVPRSAFHALSGRDGALIAGLRRRLAGNAAWLGELAEMEEQVGPPGRRRRPGSGAAASVCWPMRARVCWGPPHPRRPSEREVHLTPAGLLHSGGRAVALLQGA